MKLLISFKIKQVFLYFILGWTFAPFAEFINKYVFNDWEFLKFLFVITSVDTALGFVKAFKLKQVSSKGFSMVFNKIIVYSAALIATHTLVHFTVDNKALVAFSWFDSVVFSAIIIRETISIFENIAIIQPDAFPKSILKYLKQFDSLTGKKMQDENITNP